MIQNNVIKLKNKSPLARIGFLCENIDSINLASLCPLSEVPSPLNKARITDEIRQILFGMSILDELLTEMSGFKRHIYILGDGTIFNFINKDMIHKDFYILDKSFYLEIICTLGLAYRFNVAKKFGYGDVDIMQVRLNGWGREYCHDMENFNDYFQFKESIYAYWTPILTKFKKSYTTLFNLCDSTKRPLDVKRIHEINKTLPLKLVT